MFVAINQMRYSGKKRKKPEELETARTNEEMERKENNKIMPTGMTDLLNAEEEQQHQRKEHKGQLANAPLLLSEVCCGMAVPPPTATPTTTEPASNELTTKGTEYSTAAMANEPADIKPTCKCKNCQCNLRSDQHLKENKHHHHLHDNLHLCHHAEPYSSTISSSKYLLQPSGTSSSCSYNSTRVITSLSNVYLCMGILTLALASLSVLFYSHATNTTSVIYQNLTSPSMFPGEVGEKSPEDISSFTSSPSLFRERFRQELLASEHMLFSMVERILQQQTSDSREKQRQVFQHLQQHHHRPEQQLHNEKHISLGNVDDQRSFSTITSATNSPVNINKEDEATSTTLADLNAKDAISAAAADDNDGNFVEAQAMRRDTRMLRKHNGHSDTLAKEPETIDELLKHAKRMRRDISSSPSTSMHDPFIEFFTPNHRKVLEEQDKEIRKRTGLKGAAPGGDDWVYLNTYCRVPEKIITGFCQSTQEYCPPSPQGPEGQQGLKGSSGPPGLPGIPGPKGNRGDVGLPGPPGGEGAAGPIGPKGPKGDIGIPGRQGLDGRDGVPGEPGLDGVPGRAGADGIPGKDGIPGRDGKDGLNGKDGRDGAPGPKGSQGPPGERGLKGIAGPRGRVGKPGTDGTPGIPGVNAYKVQLKNGTFLNELLIPPSIADVGNPHIQRTVIVNEQKTLNLSCGATGNPPPHIEWRREDGRTINVNGVEMSSVSGPSLMIKHITRNHMTAYTCYADNGLAPTANATYAVEVHFQPLVKSLQTMIYAQYGRSATFECEVEAFPEAIRYWERASDGKILDPGDKYRIESYADGYKTRMILTINHLRKDDFGYYYCVARNELNVTNLGFEIFPQDPNSVMPTLTKSERVEGRMPSEPECPVCEECPDSSLYQCKDSINYNFVTQVTANGSYAGLPKRKKNCLLYAVGKPVFHRQHMNKLYVAWLRDPLAKISDFEKTYTTTDDSSETLYEYTTKRAYRQADNPHQHRITNEFHGNAHVVYNGSFYYHIKYTGYMGKYELSTKVTKNVSLPGSFGTGNKLYSTDYNYMDFNVDEVGLWVIYSTNDSNNTLVAKVNSYDLTLEFSINITLNHRKFGEMFIVCGHLYAIDSCTDKNSQIRYAVDLYTSKLLHVNLPFTNPFTRTTTVGYNPHTVELYSFDKGNALTYPIRYNEIIERGDHA